MGLSGVTFLGDNTRPILEELRAHIRATTDVDIDVVQGPPGSSEVADRSAGDADLIWACGFLTANLIDAGRLDGEIVAAPVFPGEKGPTYHSVLITRADTEIADLAHFQGTVVINEDESWSGHHALGHHFDVVGLEGPLAGVRTSGSHRASVEAVAAGEADLAAIDHTVWRHLAETTSLTARLAVIDHTRDWPTPPFTIHHRVQADTRRRLVEALTGITPGDVTGLTGIVAVRRSAYDVMRPKPLTHSA